MYWDWYQSNGRWWKGTISCIAVSGACVPTDTRQISIPVQHLSCILHLLSDTILRWVIFNEVDINMAWIDQVFTSQRSRWRSTCPSICNYPYGYLKTMKSHSFCTCWSALMMSFIYISSLQFTSMPFQPSISETLVNSLWELVGKPQQCVDFSECGWLSEWGLCIPQWNRPRHVLVTYDYD